MTHQEIEERLKGVRTTIEYAEQKLRQLPDEMLYTRYHHNGVRYYQRKKGETSGRYLGKDKQRTIKLLEEKSYYSELLRVAKQEKKELELLEDILSGMHDYNSVYLNIPVEKRHLISPYELKPEEKDGEWIRIFNKKPVPESVKLFSQNGEHVRSKSELIIADRLHAAGVPYFYEDPLILADGDPKESIVECLYWHPDFKVQNIRTGKQYHWEHFGMLDNPEYCKSCQEKLEIYAHYGYFPGENLIITSESSVHGLNVEYVDCLIEKYLK